MSKFLTSKFSILTCGTYNIFGYGDGERDSCGVCDCGERASCGACGCSRGDDDCGDGDCVDGYCVDDDGDGDCSCGDCSCGDDDCDEGDSGGCSCSCFSSNIC